MSIHREWSVFTKEDKVWVHRDHRSGLEGGDNFNFDLGYVDVLRPTGLGTHKRPLEDTPPSFTIKVETPAN